jgi:hypothetical protein
MTYEKPKKLTEIYADDEAAFALKATDMVDDSVEQHEPHRTKCAHNERVWRNESWDDKIATSLDDANKPRPNVPVLHSTVENCVADAMDSFPDQIIRGVNYDDDVKSIIATELVRLILQRIGYKKLYEKKVRSVYKKGEGILVPFWNPEYSYGLGDIDAKYLTIDQLRWDPKADDIRKGRFYAIDEYFDVEDIYEMYPDIDLNECFPDDESSREPRTEHTDKVRRNEKEDQIRRITFTWIEREPRTYDTKGGKQERVGSRTWLNTAVIIGSRVVEWMPKQYEYDRFLVDMTAYMQLDGEPVGNGLLDLFEDAADIINRIESEYVANLQAASQTRYLVNRTAGIDEKDLLNFRKKLIRGNVINEGAVRNLEQPMFSSQALNYKNAKMQEIKEQSGQMDSMVGMTGSGVTAASAIQSLQEYGAKRSRLIVQRFWEDHREFVKDILMLAKEHYNVERIIRLSRESQDRIEEMIAGAMKALSQQQEQQAAAQAGQEQNPREAAMAAVLPEGVTLQGNRLVVDFSKFSLDDLDLDYDIQIIPQRKNPATSNMINSMVAQAVGNGQMPADLGFELMEWEGKEHINKRIKQYYNREAQLKQIAQQAEDAANAANQAIATADKVTKERDALQEEVWNQKLKVLRAEFSGANTGETGEETGQTSQGAEEKISGLQAEIAQRLGAGQQGAA